MRSSGILSTDTKILVSRKTIGEPTDSYTQYKTTLESHQKVRRRATIQHPPIGTTITHPHPPHFFNNLVSFSTEQFRHIPTAMIQNYWEKSSTQHRNGESEMGY